MIDVAAVSHGLIHLIYNLLIYSIWFIYIRQFNQDAHISEAKCTKVRLYICEYIWLFGPCFRVLFWKHRWYINMGSQKQDFHCIQHGSRRSRYLGSHPCPSQKTAAAAAHSLGPPHPSIAPDPWRVPSLGTGVALRQLPVPAVFQALSWAVWWLNKLRSN